jgi:putative transposase
MDTWHWDEVIVRLHGTYHDLWRAVDRSGNILHILVQRGRDKTAAKEFFRKRLKDLTYVPRVSITDQLRSYGGATRKSLPSIEPRQHRSPNDRAENSHPTTRQPEPRTQGFKSPGPAQRFLAADSPITSHFRPRRHLLPNPVFRQEMRQRFHM